MEKKDPKQYRLTKTTIGKLERARFLMYLRRVSEKHPPSGEPEWDTVLATLADFYATHMEPAVYGTDDEAAARRTATPRPARQDAGREE